MATAVRQNAICEQCRHAHSVNPVRAPMGERVNRACVQPYVPGGGNTLPRKLERPASTSGIPQGSHPGTGMVVLKVENDQKANKKAVYESSWRH